MIAVLLLVTASEGDLKRIEGLLNYIADAKQKAAALTPLQLARLEPPNVRPHVVTYRRTPKRRTGLHYAAQKNQAPAATLLLETCKEHRKLVDAFDGDGKTALAIACKTGALATAKVFLHFGASVHRESVVASPIGAQREVSLTPLQIACVKGSTDFVEFLLRVGSDVNKTCVPLCATPLHIALWNGHDHVGQLLLDGLEFECSADWECYDCNGVSPLMVACHKGCILSAKMILELARQKWEDRSTSSSTSSGGVTTASLFLEEPGATYIRAKDVDGWDALRWGCEASDPGGYSTPEAVVECIKVLLDHPSVEIPLEAFELDEITGLWSEPAWTRALVDAVQNILTEELKGHGLGEFVPFIKTDKLLVQAKGNHHAAIDFGIQKARKIKSLKQNKKFQNIRKILRREIKKERKARARGGKKYSLLGEVQSLHVNHTTRAAAVTVGDLAAFMLPSIENKKREKRADNASVQEGSQWSSLWESGFAF